MANPYSSAYSAAYDGDSGTANPLAWKIKAKTGIDPEAEWLLVMCDEVMANIWLIAPSRIDWVTVDDLPPRVISVVVASLSRVLKNPDGHRSETLGEYSYTLSGSVVGDSFTDRERLIILRESGCFAQSATAYTAGMTPSTPLRPSQADRTFDYLTHKWSRL